MCNLIIIHIHTQSERWRPEQGWGGNGDGGGDPGSQDGNEDGTGDRNESSFGDENRDEEGNGDENEGRIGEGGGEVKKRKKLFKEL